MRNESTPSHESDDVKKWSLEHEEIYREISEMKGHRREGDDVKKCSLEHE